MNQVLRAFACGLCAITLLAGCQASQLGNGVNSGGGGSLLPTDSARNVLSFADSLESVLPSVVLIGNLQRNAQGEPQLAGLGSGAVIDARRGYIITNSHVVKDGIGYFVDLPDGRVIEARLVGMDAPTDIAVLQADGLRVDAVTIADSDRLRVGDIVFAVGYPLGLEQSLSMGVVSGLGRSSSGEGLQDFIQTDAAINSGNSGGPLLDSMGRLIGINTAILSHSGGSEGIGFSVPTSLATQVADQLITHGEVRRGSIGITMTEVNEEAAAAVGVSSLRGALVVSVRPGSAAEEAKLQPGDVITGFAGKKVRSAHGLRAWIGVATPGKAYPLMYVRNDGVEQTKQIKAKAFRLPVVENLEQLGAFIRPANSSDIVPPGVPGVVVFRVIEDSPADRAGLKVGDVIGSVNDELANDKQVCDHLVSEAKGRARLIVYRFGAALPIIIEP